MTLEEIFRQRTRSPSSGCLLWDRYCSTSGYGRVRYLGKSRFVHRVVWEAINGPIPSGLCVLHLCDTPACSEETHLFLGTQADNVHDMETKNRARKAVGSLASKTKLTEMAVIEIRHKYASGEYTRRELAAEYGVTHGSINCVVNRKTWDHVR